MTSSPQTAPRASRFVLMLLLPWLASAETPAPDTRSVDQDVQSLKKQLIDLNRDLFKLEEELLYPASTQVAVFVSVDVGTFFALDAVTLEIDDKEAKMIVQVMVIKNRG